MLYTTGRPGLYHFHDKDKQYTTSMTDGSVLFLTPIMIHHRGEQL
ncbi:MAG: hypothetical protein Q8928_05340 [Bacteroidota bacterium]|nr:hypothetical protein [Bacteroidota bacterium]